VWVGKRPVGPSRNRAYVMGRSLRPGCKQPPQDRLSRATWSSAWPTRSSKGSPPV